MEIWLNEWHPLYKHLPTESWGRSRAGRQAATTGRGAETKMICKSKLSFFWVQYTLVSYCISCIYKNIENICNRWSLRFFKSTLCIESLFTRAFKALVVTRWPSRAIGLNLCTAVSRTTSTSALPCLGLGVVQMARVSWVDWVQGNIQPSQFQLFDCAWLCMLQPSRLCKRRNGVAVWAGSNGWPQVGSRSRCFGDGRDWRCTAPGHWHEGRNSLVVRALCWLLWSWELKRGEEQVAQIYVLLTFDWFVSRRLSCKVQLSCEGRSGGVHRNVTLRDHWLRHRLCQWCRRLQQSTDGCFGLRHGHLGVGLLGGASQWWSNQLCSDLVLSLGWPGALVPRLSQLDSTIAGEPNWSWAFMRRLPIWWG